MKWLASDRNGSRKEMDLPGTLQVPSVGGSPTGASSVKGSILGLDDSGHDHSARGIGSAGPHSDTGG